MSDIYPEKPVIKEKESKDNYKNTLLSMVLFVITFYIFFSDEILFISFLLFVLFIHELGHFSFMKKFKYKHVKMLFVPLMGAFVQGKKKIYSWNDRGSDERQYCSPFIDLPICSLMRSKYGEYKEYHNSLDQLGSVVTNKGLSQSIEVYKKIIEDIERSNFPISV